MSRLYLMYIIVKNIDDLNRHEKQDLVSALSKEWPFSFDEFCCDSDNLESEAEGSLCGVEGEEEFVTRITHAVWNAVGKYLPIEVNATRLEQLPYNYYDMEESDYETFLKNKRIELKSIEKLKCAYCGQEKKEITFCIGASLEPAWTMVEGTGKITCPNCYHKAMKEREKRLAAHFTAYPAP